MNNNNLILENIEDIEAAVLASEALNLKPIDHIDNEESTEVSIEGNRYYIMQ